MTKIIVVSAPRSGTHMLVRMISRAGHLPWKVPVQTSAISLINEESWVIGVHDIWENLKNFDACLIGLKRNKEGHMDSLSRFGMKYELWKDVIDSLPEDRTVDYSLLVNGNKKELYKLKKITGIDGIVPEPYYKRYSGPFDWCM